MDKVNPAYKIELNLTEDEMKNLIAATRQDDYKGHRESWKTNTRKVLQAKCIAAIAASGVSMDSML